MCACDHKSCFLHNFNQIEFSSCTETPIHLKILPNYAFKFKLLLVLTQPNRFYKSSLFHPSKAAFDDWRNRQTQIQDASNLTSPGYQQNSSTCGKPNLKKKMSYKVIKTSRLQDTPQTTSNFPKTFQDTVDIKKQTWWI